MGFFGLLGLLRGRLTLYFKCSFFKTSMANLDNLGNLTKLSSQMPFPTLPPP